MGGLLEDRDYRRIMDMGSEVLSCGSTDDMMDAAMHHIGRLIKSRSLLFSVTKSANWKWEAIRSLRLDCDFPYLMTTRFKDDPGRQALLQSWAHRRGNILNSDKIWPPSTQPTGRYYNELCKPRGIRHVMAITIPAGDDHFGALVMHRSSDDGHFDRRDEQLARSLLPFLKGGLDRTCLLQKQQWAGWVMEKMLPALPYQQVVALDAELKPLAAAPVSSPLLDRLLRDFQRVHGQQPGFDPDIAATCRKLLSDRGDDAAVLSVRSLGHGEAGSRFRVEIDCHRVGREQRLLLRIASPSRDPHRFGAVDGAGLTRQERRVVALAAAGKDNADIAREMGLAASTVAHHLSAALRKTGRSARWQLNISPAMAEKVGALPLSARQKQVLTARLSGLSTAAAASRLGIGVVTVRNHLRAIYSGLGVSGFKGVMELLSQDDGHDFARRSIPTGRC